MTNEKGEGKPRVLVVGLDGATFDVIKPLVAAGRLPTLAQLMDQGAHGELRSTYPPITPSAWTSFATGKNPGRHGIYDFQRVEPDTYAFVPVPANQHNERTLWRILSDHDRESVVLDVPFTYPPESIQGAMITGFGTPVTAETVFTHPPELRDELITHCGSCELSVSGTEGNLHPSFFRRWDDILASRERIAPYLMDKIDWDFFMIVYGVTDNLQHILWPFLEPQHPAYHSDEGAHYRELLFNYYEKVDGLMEQLLARCDKNTTVLVMSDHGFGSTRTSKYLAKLLMDEGLLRYRTGGVRGGLMKRLLNIYHTTPFLSALVRRLGGRQKMGLKSALTRTALLPTPENTDWEHTQAFPGGYGLQVYINTRGRFAKGTVAPGSEYQALQAHIAERLLALTDPITGEPITKTVHRAQDIYNGPLTDQSPDLIVEYRNAFRPEDSYTGPLNPGLEGNHVMEGVFIARGPQILAGEVTGSQIIDLAPMVLYLLGLPVPDDMDGRVLTEIFNPEYVADHPVQGEASTEAEMQSYDYSDEEAELIRGQLRALGYID